MRPARALWLGAMLLTATTGVASAACLDAFAGTWQGSGLVSDPDSAEPERLRCRLTTQQDTGTDRAFSLRCASLGAAKTLEFLVSCDPTGTVASFEIRKPVLRSGDRAVLRATDRRLVLESGATDELLLERSNDRITLDFGSDDAPSGMAVLRQVP